MRDGSILAVGRGNPEWNDSAPHGAGRIMSRMINIVMHGMKSLTALQPSAVHQDFRDQLPVLLCKLLADIHVRQIILKIAAVHIAQAGSCPEWRPSAPWIWRSTAGRWREFIRSRTSGDKIQE